MTNPSKDTNVPASERRQGDRRKSQLPYEGVERRKHARRSGIERRSSDRAN